MTFGWECTNPSATIKDTRFLLGTVINITAKGDSYNETKDAIDKAFDEIARLESILSKYKENSGIYNINNSKDKAKPIKIHDEAFGIIKRSIEFSKLSDGAFDITCVPLLELWGFAGTPVLKTPDKNGIRKVLKNVGFENIILDEDKKTVSLSSNRMKIDLGGIAKGYAVDRAIAVLKDNGIKNAIVDAGGDIYCLGSKSKNLSWNVGIQHPRDKNKLISRISLKDKAVATSGDYERFFVIEGKKYSHIVNPKTGYPVEEVPMSVTVVADDCTIADALATAVFVLGPRDGIRLLNGMPNVSGIVISKSGKEGYTVDLTENLKGKIGFKF